MRFYRATLCYSAVYAMALRLSVRLSQVGVVSKRLDRSSSFFVQSTVHLFYTVFKGDMQ